MIRKPVIIDVDTGVDDAVALLAAFQLPQLDIRALTTVAGNVSLDKTTRNTRCLVDLIGKDVPIYVGAAKPIFTDPIPSAPYVHGEDGLGGVVLPEPKKQVEAMAACDAIYEEAVRQNGELEIIAVGPLTNLGLAFLKYRDLPKYIKRIVIMGGAASFGNVTPAAEFNIYGDPEAADIVFTSGVPVHMCGLDMTLKTWFTPEEVESFAALGTPQGQFARDVLQKAQDFSLMVGLPGVCMHDPSTVLYAADDSIFTAEPAGVRVETKGVLTRGKTVTDLYSDHQMEVKNAYVVTDVDREALRDWLLSLVAAY